VTDVLLEESRTPEMTKRKLNWAIIGSLCIGFVAGEVTDVMGVQTRLVNSLYAGFAAVTQEAPHQSLIPDQDTASIVSVMGFDISNLSGWSIERQGYTDSLDRFLGPYSNEARTTPLSYTFEMPDGTGRAVVDFDLLLFGSWDALDPQWASPDGDGMIFEINGTPVSAELFHTSDRRYHRSRVAHAVIDGTTYRLALTDPIFGQHFGMNADSGDQSWHVRIEAVSPNETMELAMRNTANDHTSEVFGVDNVVFRAAPF
jgi:hypothetical protein